MSQCAINCLVSARLDWRNTGIRKISGNVVISLTSILASTLHRPSQRCENLLLDREGSYQPIQVASVEMGRMIWIPARSQVPHSTACLQSRMSHFIKSCRNMIGPYFSFALHSTSIQTVLVQELATEIVHASDLGRSRLKLTAYDQLSNNNVHYHQLCLWSGLPRSHPILRRSNQMKVRGHHTVRGNGKV